ncbi:hypothetical protein JW824_01495 [bacterium]|nr:hypothetical protein [bacterium]
MIAIICGILICVVLRMFSKNSVQFAGALILFLITIRYGIRLIRLVLKVID